MSRAPDVRTVLCRTVRALTHGGLDLHVVAVCKIGPFREPRGAPRYYWQATLAEEGERIVEQAGPFDSPELAIRAALGHGVAPTDIRGRESVVIRAARAAQSRLDAV